MITMPVCSKIHLRPVAAALALVLPLAAYQAPVGSTPSGAYIATLGRNGAAPALLIWLNGHGSGWMYDPPWGTRLQVTAGPLGAVQFSTAAAGGLRFQGTQQPDGVLRGQLSTPDRDSWAHWWGLTRQGRPVTWVRPRVGHCPVRPGRYTDLRYIPSEAEWIGTGLFLFGCGKGDLAGLLTLFSGDAGYSIPLYSIGGGRGVIVVAALDASIRIGSGPEYSSKRIKLIRVAHGIELRPAQVLDAPEVLHWRGPVSVPPEP